MDETTPKLLLDGAAYPLVQPDDMTMREQMEFEKIADAGVDGIMRLEDDYRAAVVVAWMAVSIKRDKPQTPMRQIVERLEELKAEELKQAWEGIVSRGEDEAGQIPPAQTPPASSPEREKPTEEPSSNVSELPRAPTTPPGTGDPGSESDPETLAN